MKKDLTHFFTDFATLVTVVDTAETFLGLFDDPGKLETIGYANTFVSNPRLWCQDKDAVKHELAEGCRLLIEGIYYRIINWTTREGGMALINVEAI